MNGGENSKKILHEGEQNHKTMAHFKLQFREELVRRNILHEVRKAGP